MNKVSHVVWLARWIQRLLSALLRNRKVLDLLPSLLVPRGRIAFDRRVMRFRRFELRKQLGDYWAYDHCVSVAALDIKKFPQSKSVQEHYEKLMAHGKRPLILDCGANIGLGSYWLSVEYPGALVIAVEPDAENVAIAAKNTKYCDNVKIFQAAVAAHDCRITLTNTDGGPDAYRTETDNKGALVGYSISSLIIAAGGDIDNLLLAKIDIEGFENELFKSNTGWVEKLPALLVETHDWMLPGRASANNLLKVISRAPRDFIVHGEHIVSFRL